MGEKSRGREVLEECLKQVKKWFGEDRKEREKIYVFKAYLDMV